MCAGVLDVGVKEERSALFFSLLYGRVCCKLLLLLLSTLSAFLESVVCILVIAFRSA